MKKQILFSLVFILANHICLHAVNPKTLAKRIEEQKKQFPFFAQFPTDIQTIIIADVVDAGSFENALKQLARLRRTNKQFKSLIDNEGSGRQILEMIAHKYPQKPNEKA